MVFLVRGTGEEATLKFLLCVMEFDDDQAIDVFGTVDFFGVGEAGFFQDPVVVLVLGTLFHPEHVSRTKHGDSEVLLNVANGRVGGERTVGDVNHVTLPHFILHLGGQHIIEIVEDDGLVHHATNDPTRRAPLGFEVVRVCFVASLFAVGHGREAFLDGAIADVKGRMRGGHPDAKFQSVVFLNDGGNIGMVNHARHVQSLSCNGGF